MSTTNFDALSINTLTIAGTAVQNGTVAGTLDVTGAMTAASTLVVTGLITGTAGASLTAGLFVPVTSSYSANGAIALTDAVAKITKTSAAAMTLAAPGAGNVGKFLYVTSSTAYAHVTTVTGLAGGTTMTAAAAIGNGFLLYGLTSTVWTLVSNTGYTQSA